VPRIGRCGQLASRCLNTLFQVALANLYARMGRTDEAIDALERAMKRAPDDPYLPGLKAYVLVRAGRKAEAETMLRELDADPKFPRYRLATITSNLHAGSSDAAVIDRIFDYLEAAWERQEEELTNLRSPDAFGRLQTHPRMVRLLERMK
jgi:predicted Zn-dependent protease